MAIGIREARGTDAERVTRIYVESWNAGFGDLMGTIRLDEARIRRWENDLTSGRNRWWVAETTEDTHGPPRIVGLVGVGPSRDPIDPKLGELDTIAVDPTHWRGGVGTALMRTALRALAESGYREAVLWTVTGYARGQAFYEATGWRRDGNTRDDGRQLSFRHSLRDLDVDRG
ncbi:N-acetyltransferase family protein [Actinopolymorpha singaporensis]|uniref:Ribosomal protein S18 acetylase RimI n=1 Tax=Actinopolymorpha singaporensis TaxID=117157 RepID=A0A1H1RX83_9ACTN|nr:GNAT family N-acetyltransferase [Actinopolymorpha singaporensis]SDS40285.1 Ribosomal protein S18 acetylase RimI [Actinopolymorpha singaporensis]